MAYAPRVRCGRLSEDSSNAAAYGRVLAERLDPKRFPIMVELTANAEFEDEEGDVAPMV
jgi:hypothetical protein